MTENASFAEQAALGGQVVVGQDLAELIRLYEPNVVLVTAPTRPSAGAQRYADALAESGPRTTELDVRTFDGAPAPGALDGLATAAAPDACAWTAYVSWIVELYASLLGAERVGVRQMVADGPHCPRFHVDRVAARGVLHVLGAPTEWLQEGAVDRARLGHAGGVDDASSGLVLDWGRLERAEPGTLAVFKGATWPGAEDRAVVHRSPPADGTRRVLVTLDWIE